MQNHPTDAHFPFKPYESQSKLASAIALRLEAGGVGIFESPTGTGKTLAVLSGICHWLETRPHPIHPPSASSRLDEIASNAPHYIDDDEPQWVHEQFSESQDRRNESRLVEAREKFEKLVNSFQSTKTRIASSCSRSRSKRHKSSQFIRGNEDDEESSTSDSSRESDEDIPDSIKVFYCSRTHSQLSQVISEGRKVVSKQPLRILCLGSRKQLCVNPKVNDGSNVSTVNERCTDLQKQPSSAKERKKGGCPFLSKGKRNLVQSHVMTDYYDIEELHKLGKSLDSCPYYGTREAINKAQIILLPYNLILLQSARESLGIQLKGNCVVIDEAHNLMDTITNIHSSSLSHEQLDISYIMLHEHVKKYSERFKAENYQNIQRLTNLIKLIKNGMSRHFLSKESNKEDCVITETSEFIRSIGAEHFNIFEIEKFARDYELHKKIHFDKITASQSPVEAPLLGTLNFISCLTNPTSYGRIVIRIAGAIKDCIIQFILLNPEQGFRSVLEEAHSVILVGGTMQPVEDLKYQLFRDIPPAKFSIESFGHVIDPDRVLPIVVSEGLNGTPFEFTFQNRENKEMYNQLGQYLCNLTTIVPGGVVVFFSSYSVEERISSEFSSSGVFERISRKKKIFREKAGAVGVDELLLQYRESIDKSKEVGSNSNGAVLFAVVGGRLSEGINFSDDYGRCVVMVGLPYPSRGDAVLQEKMRYFDQMSIEQRAQGLVQTFGGADYYENLCMKAVNQSIGRAIRHAQDFATIILIDRRYSQRMTQAKLSGWIRDRIGAPPKTAQTFAQIVAFFKKHKA